MTTPLGSVTFAACGAIQSYVIPATGSYLISAAGAQGGAGQAPGGRGAFVQGLFYLREGEVVNFVVGQHGGPGLVCGLERAACGGGGGGGTFVWKGAPAGPTPTWPLLVAGGGGGGGCDEGGDGWVRSDAITRPGCTKGTRPGHGGVTDPCRHFGGGGGTGWFHAGTNGPGPIYCRGGERWGGGAGIVHGGMCGGDGGFGGGGGGGFLGYAAGGGGGYDGGHGGGQVECQLSHVSPSGGGSSYNAGRNQTNQTGFQSGHGAATITAIDVPSLPPAPLIRAIVFPTPGQSQGAISSN